MSITVRSVGHYTEIQKELERWIHSRSKLELDTKTLRDALMIVIEAREMSLWIQELRRAGRFTGLNLEVP